MALQVIATDRAPAAIGPYSQGIKAGDYVFFSGQIPLNPLNGELVSGGIEVQTERVMANIAGVLESAGLSFDRVVKTTIFLTDLADFATVNAIYGRYFSMAPPARSTVQVVALPRGAAIEIEVVAYAG